MYVTQEQQQWLVATLIQAARDQPNRTIEFHDEQGAVIASFTVHELPKRPKDMPRHLRPKRKLSKRQRIAAKREKVLVPQA